MGRSSSSSHTRPAHTLLPLAATERTPQAISLFPREIAITSILFLVLGDMVAALIGVSFGGETVVVKLGRDHKKSVEGSLAMFLLCFSVCCLVFARVHLVEYVAFVAAAVVSGGPSDALMLATCTLLRYVAPNPHAFPSAANAWLEPHVDRKFGPVSITADPGATAPYNLCAAQATITELYSEDLLWGLNDNVTIPFFSCIALTWAFDRTQFCA